MSEFQIRKTHITQSRIVDNSLHTTELAKDQVLAKVDKFALSANNITYAVVGEQIGYWQFFPPHNETADGTKIDTHDWGILPVWGFAEVVASSNDDVPIGERVFGYFPPASHLILQPTKVNSTSWVDASVHRSQLPPAYNTYRRVEHESGYDKVQEDLRMLLYPLHITAFALYDFFQENKWFGATQLVMLSASSKTSSGLAYGVQHHESEDNPAPSLVALTSDRNLEIVKRLNAYDSVLSYAEISKIDAKQATLVVDMSGNSRTLSELHKHLGDNMKFCSNVGLTDWHNWDDKGSNNIIKERSEFFFAPSQIQKRLQEWGPQGFDKKSSEYMALSIGRSREWLKMTEIDGLEGMQSIFEAVCEGNIAADAGIIVRMRS